MPERALALRDMLDACERCLDYTAGMDQAAFIEDRRTYDATIRNIEIVGEAANNVPEPYGMPIRRLRGVASSTRGIESFTGME